MWDVSAGDTFSISRDEDLGSDVLTVREAAGLVLTSRTSLRSGVEISALVRLRTGRAPNASAIFTVALGVGAEGKEQGTAFLLNRSGAADSLTCSVYGQQGPLHDVKALAAESDWLPQVSSSETYSLRAIDQYLPGWEEGFRARVEADMASIPAIDDKWLSVRIELRKGMMRFWLDDRLIARKEDAALDPQGAVCLNLSQGVQLARFRVGGAPETAGFLPVRLAGYLNARVFRGGAAVRADSLPPAGEVSRVQGVPFVVPGVNPESHDHIDLSRSLFRQSNLSGYFQTRYGALPRWRGSVARDPARIQVRIPFGWYDRLYVIAACDGDRDEVPVLSAMFYRPGAGYAETFETRVPEATAASAPDGAMPLPVRLEDGRAVNLWLVKIPIDPARLTTLSDLDIIEVEFTKKVQQYRSYPDPISYGYHQGGRASSVHLYAATLGYAPVRFAWEPDRFGHVWTSPEAPAYTATVQNHTPSVHTGKLSIVTRSYDGTEETRQEQALVVPPGQSVPAKVSVTVERNGYHDISATLTMAGQRWVEERSFVRLAPDTRSVRWTEGEGAMFGFWSYRGGHYTPNADHHVRLMTLAGARGFMHQATNGLSPEVIALMDKHWGRGQSTAYYVAPQAWAAEGTHDPEKVATFQKEIMANVDQWEKDVPDAFRPDCIQFFAEPHISPRLTAGNFPEYWNGEPFVYTEEETQRLRMFMETARIAAETYRETLPDRTLLIPWGDPGFAIPLLRAGFPTNLIDGCGIDVPNFERLPEMQLADNVVHRLYALRKEFEKVGMTNPALQVCEGAFIPTEPGACTWREQMDIYNRWTLLDLAYGVTRFYAGWFAFDCGNYYGSEHYGGCGIQRRIPYCDPKPAYAAFATMTDKLNGANFDGWVETGSLTTFCLRFKHATRGFVYALWTIRGARPATLTLNADGKVRVTDAMNNTQELSTTNRQVTVGTDPSVVYVTFPESTAAVDSVAVGTPDHSGEQPAEGAQLVADLGDGSWQYTDRREPLYENNHWGFYPYAGKFSAEVMEDPERGAVLASRLEKQDTVRELMPWYNVLKPSRPVELDGAPSHLGLWVKGASDWGRFIYILRDAKGERWISIGTRDDYNCDDTHGWSRFNFDGWRYLRFELPGHLGYDSFRRYGTTWWRSGPGIKSGPAGAVAEGAPPEPPEPGDNIVDLPLRLEEMIVEQRSHILYVNDVQPVASDTVRFGKLYVEYASPEDATREAVRVSRLRMPVPDEVPDLPNPVADMADGGVGAPTKITRLAAPEHYYDGTRMHVHFDPVPGAQKYLLWVSAHADGRGAVNMVPTGIQPGDLVTGLRPGVRLYYWVTYTDEEGRMSKPSPVHAEVTVDNFKEK